MNTTDQINFFKDSNEMKLRTRWTSRCYPMTTIIKTFNCSARGEIYEGIPVSQYREVLTWLRFFKLIDEKNRLTGLGNLIYKYDRYFEEDITRLICQFNLAKSPTIFGELFDSRTNEIDKDFFIESIYQKYPEANLNSVERDFSVLINTYLRKRQDPGEGWSLFNYYGLIRKENNRYYRKALNINYFDPWFTTALLYPFSGEVNQHEIYEWIKGPFNLDATDFLNLMYRSRDVKVVRTAGLDVLYLPESINFLDYIERSYIEKERIYGKYEL